MITFKPLYNLISLNQLIRFSAQNLIFPFYHTISDNRLPHISNLYQLKTKKQFINDLDYLCKYYSPITIQELSNIVYKNQKVNKPLFHLTFDDGLKEIYYEIAPILERKGIPATFFINTDFIDNKQLFYRYKISLIIENINNNEEAGIKISEILKLPVSDTVRIIRKLLSFNMQNTDTIDLIAKRLNIDFNKYLECNQPYLTQSQINKLIKKGFTIGSHSLNHPFFKDINFNEQKRQVSESFFYLKNEFNIDSLFFSFPFSDEAVELRFFDWLYNNANCKLSFGTSGIKHDYSKLHLHRIEFDSTSTDAKAILKSEYFRYLLKKIFFKTRIIRT